MSDPASRPRPQYGEYATPEQQAARIRESMPPLHHEHAHSDFGATTPAQQVPQSPSGSPAPVGVEPQQHTQPQLHAQGQPEKPKSTIERTITLALLGFGLVYVFFTAISFFSYGESMTQAFIAFGVSAEDADVHRNQVWGTAMALVLIFGYALTAFFAIRRVRARRHAWWIPLVGAIVTWIIVSIILAVALVGDPGFEAYRQLMENSMLGTPAP